MRRARHYVHMDELMEGAGKRLAELTGAEWGIVTPARQEPSRRARRLHGGRGPGKMAMLPDTTGMKNEVWSPNAPRLRPLGMDDR